MHVSLAVFWWQWLLNGLGWVLAKIYEVIPSYGVAIIGLTVVLRLILFPLGVKQIRNMYAMQAIQPKLKALQQKHKNNKQKLNEEMMNLYREHGVNPLGGCLPMLVQLPVLAAMFAVLHFPAYDRYSPNHLPQGTKLYAAVQQATVQNTTKTLSVGGMNLLCSMKEAGSEVTVRNKAGHVVGGLNCGHGLPSRIPYVILILLSIGTTFYQQRQVQSASAGAATQQQKTLTLLMPLMMGFWGFYFPAGLVVYWTVSNAWQIGQQHFIAKGVKQHAAEIPDGGSASKKKPSGGGSRPPAKGTGGGKNKGKTPPKARGGRASGGGGGGGQDSVPRKGFMTSWLEKAEKERARREADARKKKPDSGGGSGRDRKKGS